MSFSPFRGIFIYQKNNRIVDGLTFRQDLLKLDDVFFNEIKKIIYDEFDVLLCEKWFEEHVYKILLKEYDKELADNTWRYIQLPNEETFLLDFISKAEIKDIVERMTELSIMF